jgi:hypothetical protein
MTHPVQRIIDLAISALLGAALFAVGRFFIHEPLGLALWSAAATICLLPVAQAFLPVIGANHRQECLCHWRYAFAVAPIIVGAGLIAGWIPSVIIAAVALSLIGGASLLAAFRLPPTYAIAFTMLGASLAFTWPIWAANLLAAHDVGSWLQRFVDCSPAFALNATVSPEDALTHRPIAYRMMNLGQDVSYAMPANVWPCVGGHAGVGIVGLIGWGLFGRRWTRMKICHPEEL